MSYTKGEWHIKKLPNTGQPVVVVNDDDLVAAGVTEDDAHLISAAPDMYEALTDIIEQADKTKLPLGADLADSIRVFGKQAKAKAEGKEFETIINHILTKEQRDAGLNTHEDDHNLYITDTATGKTVATLGNHATIKEIHIAANYYLIEKARRHNGNNQA